MEISYINQKKVSSDLLLLRRVRISCVAVRRLRSRRPVHGRGEEAAADAAAAAETRPAHSTAARTAMLATCINFEN